MLQIEKNLLKKVTKDLRDIYDKYCENLINNPNEEVIVHNSLNEWYEAIQEEGEILQEIKKNGNLLIVYDIKNHVVKEMINVDKTNPYIPVFAMNAYFYYDPNERIIRIFTSKIWYRSAYSALLLNGWMGIIDVMSNGFIAPFNLLDGNEIEKSNIIKRFITYLRKLEYLSSDQADDYILQTIGEDNHSLNKLEELKDAVFYIKMAENSYRFRDYVYFNPFVISFEMLQKFRKRAYLSYGIQKRRKLGLHEKILSKIGRHISNFKISIKLQKLLSIANQNALYHHWEVDQDQQETNQFLEEAEPEEEHYIDANF